MSGKTTQNYLLVSRDVVVVAILKLSLIMLPFRAYITNQSTFVGVRQQCDPELLKSFDYISYCQR